LSAQFLKDSLSRKFKIAPGQTRPITLIVELMDSSVSEAKIQLSIKEITASDSTTAEILSVPIPIKHVSRYDAHKVTHIHPSGIVSYAVLRPPSKNATCVSEVRSAPVMVLLHGAGVEADSTIVKNSFDKLPDICAWLLMPSGVTTWSGDDWRMFRSNSGL
jgi:hypothetical protein